MADAGGTLSLSQLANQSGLSLHTIHRLLRTLVDLGYIRQESSRGEQETGVRCVAVAIPETASRLTLSVSGPAGRVTDELIERAVPLLTNAGKALSAELS
jgi:IclR family transcriptional regulator, acetate operon repressor